MNQQRPEHSIVILVIENVWNRFNTNRADTCRLLYNHSLSSL